MADVGLDADQFAQTRGDDDLFDDEIIPVSTEDMTAVVEEDVITQEMEHMQLQQQEVGLDMPDIPSDPSPAPIKDVGREREGGGYRSRGNGRGNRRGRGDSERGRGGRGRRAGGGKNNSHVSPPGAHSQSKNGGADVLDGGEQATAGEGQEAHSSSPDAQDEGGDSKEGTESHSTPTRNSNENESEPGTAKVQSVKGDRSATGGIKKPKLTEEELSERMAAAKLKAAEQRRVHERAKADEAAEQRRAHRAEADEAAEQRRAQEKRRAENKNRRALENEREQNRMRKLGAQTGREWDAEKKEEDYTQRNNRGSAFRRGAHGGVVDDRSPPHPSAAFDPDGNPSRGRGGRGRGRGGGYRGGRGGSHRESNIKPNDEMPGGIQQQKQTAPVVDAENEFPSLPEKPTTAPATSAISTGMTTGTAAESSSGKSPLTPLTPQGSWAEQVELSHNAAAEADLPSYQRPEQTTT